jgi:hypothetical protein
MLGYETGGKAYRLYDSASKRVNVSRDVVLDEGASWDWGEPVGSTLTIDNWVLPQPPFAKEGPLIRENPASCSSVTTS